MAVILDTWLSGDGHILPPATGINIPEVATYEAIPEDEESDESEGVVLFEATVLRIPSDVEDAWIGVRVSADGEDG
ncbi:hypothetical protein BDR05DRAFT_994859 [Suillus weaverae]|nr:hypothetical protein BDR05DRAFT_994859 [Suillus weaverae]